MYFLFKLAIQNHKWVASLLCYFYWRVYETLSYTETAVTSHTGGLINGLSTVSVDSLHYDSNLKVVRRPLGAKYDKVAFRAIEFSTHKII